MQCKLRFPLLQHMISISWYTQYVPRPGPSPPRRFWPLPRPAPHCGEGGVPRPAPSRRFFALPLPAPPRPVKKIASPPIPGFHNLNNGKDGYVGPWARTHDVYMQVQQSLLASITVDIVVWIWVHNRLQCWYTRLSSALWTNNILLQEVISLKHQMVLFLFE